MAVECTFQSGDGVLVLMPSCTLAGAYVGKETWGCTQRKTALFQQEARGKVYVTAPSRQNQHSSYFTIELLPQNTSNWHNVHSAKCASYNIVNTFLVFDVEINHVDH